MEDGEDGARRGARSVGEAETEVGFAVAGGDLGDHVLEPAGDVGVDLLGGEGEELCVAFDLAVLLSGKSFSLHIK